MIHELQLSHFQCGVCGAVRENTAGGNFSLCPNGHGRLFPKMARSVTKWTQRMIAVKDLPEAHVVNGKLVSVDGKEFIMECQTKGIALSTAARRVRQGRKIVRLPSGRFAEVREASKAEAEREVGCATV